jgi:Flp pilus assembly protein TadD
VKIHQNSQNLIDALTQLNHDYPRSESILR